MPSYYQHPSRTTIQTRSSTKHTLKSPLAVPSLLTEILLNLPHQDLLTSAVRVCKEWKGVVDGEEFDGKLFRLRTTTTGAGGGGGGGGGKIREKIGLTEMKEFELHPMFKKMLYYPSARETVFPDGVRLGGAGFLGDSFVWPPVKMVQVGYRHPTPGFRIFSLLVRNDKGITLREVIEYWERAVCPEKLLQDPWYCSDCAMYHSGIDGEYDDDEPDYYCDEWELRYSRKKQEVVLTLRGWQFS